MSASTRRTLTGIALTLGLPAVLVAWWWVLSADSTSFYAPPLSDILGVFRETWFTGRMRSDVLPSLGRLAAGYALALVVGVGAGLVIGALPVVRAFTEPVLEFLRAIPPPVFVPVLMLFAGIGTEMKILVVASGCVWPLLLNTVEGVRGIDDVLRDTVAAYRIRRVRTLVALTLRGASPQIMTGARQALSIGIILMVISELFAATNGLGFTIVQFQRSFSIPEMWSGVILLGLIGVLLSLLLRGIERPVLAWYRGHRAAQRGELR